MDLSGELEAVDGHAPLVNERTRIVDQNIDSRNERSKLRRRGPHRLERRQVGDDGLDVCAARGLED